MTMSSRNKKFHILLCGKKELMDRLRTVMAGSPEIHFQYTSSPRFLLGRALFNAPDAILFDSTCEPGTLHNTVKNIRSQFAGVSVFIIATSADPHEAVEMMKSGATSFFVFPHDLRKLDDKIKK